MVGVEEQIRELLMNTGAVDENAVSLTSRLFHDLGLDGDDAVEFFEAVERRFQVDLTTLYTPWNEHFGPEMGNPFLGIAAGLLVAIGVAFARRESSLVVLIEAALFVIVVGAMVWVSSWFHRRTKPITVGDVVSAVERGVSTI